MFELLLILGLLWSFLGLSFFANYIDKWEARYEYVMGIFISGPIIWVGAVVVGVIKFFDLARVYLNKFVKIFGKKN